MHGRRFAAPLIISNAQGSDTRMEIVVIVNIIASLAIMLGGLCMRKYADSPADYTIGFRTKSAMSSEKAWSFANKRCGTAWLAEGVAAFAAALASLLFIHGTAGSWVQTAVLALLIAAVAVTVVVVEMQLKSIEKE